MKCLDVQVFIHLLLPATACNSLSSRFTCSRSGVSCSSSICCKIVFEIGCSKSLSEASVAAG